MPQLKTVKAGGGFSMGSLMQELRVQPGLLSKWGIDGSKLNERSGLPLNFDPNNWEIIFKPKYDRVQYAAAGSTSLSFFSKPWGSTDTLNTSGTSGSRVKSYRDTNADQQNQQSDRGFIMLGVSIGYIPLSTGIAATAMLNFMDDMSKIAFGSYLEFTLIAKPYIDVPLWMFPAPFRGLGAAAMAMYGQTSATENVLGSGGGMGGNGKITECYPCDPPYLIVPGEGYKATITSDGTALSSSNPIDIVMCLVGYELRPKQ